MAGWGSLALLLAAAGATAPQPAPSGLACERFLPLPASASPATHEPAAFGLAPPKPIPQAFYSAVHTLFLDEPIARLAAEAGFDTVVQVFPWRDLNPAPGRFTWAAADSMVGAARRHQLNLVVRLDMPPDWARAAAEEGLPFSLPAYLDYVAAVAARYRGHVLGYLIWNEPNLAAEWSRSGEAAPDHWESYAGRVAEPAEYLGVVGAAYAVLKRADPAALVAAGGLAPTNEISERATDDRAFLEALYADGVPACFDVLAVHSYAYGLSPEAAATANDGLNLARLDAVQGVLSAHGDTRPLWITELGYTVEGGGQPAVSEMEQAHYLVGAYRRVRRDWPLVQMLTVWNLSYGQRPGDDAAGFSLVTPERVPRPAWAALQQWHQAAVADPTAAP